MSQGRLISASRDAETLDTLQLERLEQAFREWAATPGTAARRTSRGRILLIFLLIRYTGAKLNEVLALEPDRDIDADRRTIIFRTTEDEPQQREVEISENLAREIKELLLLLRAASGLSFTIDPAFVRRKFYERAEACGFDKKRGGPEMIRKARAVELMQNNMPLPAVQRLLGHSTPNLTTSYVSFSDTDMAVVTRLYMERESGRKTSARNSFFGKVGSLRQGEVQTLVELITPDGASVMTMITNTSVERLGLKPGRLVTAEVKAPWLMLEHSGRSGASSADNYRDGVITGIRAGGVNTECAVGLPDGTELCAVLSTPGFTRLGLGEGDQVRVLFSAYAVILHAE